MLRIDVPKHLRPGGADDAPPVLAGIPRRVKAELRAPRDADAVTRDDAEDHGAGGETRTVDHDVLAGRADRVELVEIGTDLSAGIVGDADRGGSRCRYQRREKRPAEHCANFHPHAPSTDPVCPLRKKLNANLSRIQVTFYAATIRPRLCCAERTRNPRFFRTCAPPRFIVNEGT